MQKPNFSCFKRFNSLYLRITICILGLLFSWSIQAQSKIFWKADRPLTFSDFKGEPTHRRIAALSYCGIRFNSCNSRNPTYEVQAYFEPHNSWAWKNYRYSYVIKHEQLHFDIAEIYARKLRKYFAKYQVPLSQAKSVYQEFYQEFEAFQEEYDEETRHGTNDSQQKKWDDKIAQLLEDYQEYAVDTCY